MENSYNSCCELQVGKQIVCIAMVLDVKCLNSDNLAFPKARNSFIIDRLSRFFVFVVVALSEVLAKW